jgi:hypothetical protein
LVWVAPGCSEEKDASSDTVEAPSSKKPKKKRRRRKRSGRRTKVSKDAPGHAGVDRTAAVAGSEALKDGPTDSDPGIEGNANESADDKRFGVLHAKAEAELRAGEEEEARETLSELLKEDPGHPDGNELLEKLDAPQAPAGLEDFRKLVDSGQVSEALRALWAIKSDDERYGKARHMRLELATHEVFNCAADTAEPWLNLRREESSTSEGIAQMVDGTKVRRVGSGGKFWKVAVVDGDGVGKVGYAHSRWLRPYVFTGQ